MSDEDPEVLLFSSRHETTKTVVLWGKWGTNRQSAAQSQNRRGQSVPGVVERARRPKTREGHGLATGGR